MNKVLTVIVVLILIAGAAYFFVSQHASPAPDQNAQPAATQDSSGGQSTSDSNASVSASVNVGTGAPTSATVAYDGNNFSPSTITIAKGGTITFTDTAGSMWVASNPHPVHTGYDGTSRSQHCASGYSGPSPFDQCGSGSSFTFTFTKTGSWGYHDHMNTGAGGTVVVQ